MTADETIAALESLARRLVEIEDRVKFLEESGKYMKAIAEKRRRNRCHFVADKSCPDGKFWYPQCMGGAVHGKDGCTCQ